MKRLHIVSAVMFSSITAPAPLVSAAPLDPTAVHCEGAVLAHQLGKDPDVNPDGSPIKIGPDGRGKFVPVVMAHGWTGQSTHDDGRKGQFSHKIDLSTNQLAAVPATRSLIGQLQRIPGVAVFTFDYHDYSARWVDDQNIGPALGNAIDCLFKATGEKVIVVAHSMGGLAARYALTHQESRSKEVSTVVTFGTPTTGSLIAMLGDAALNLSAGVDRAISVVRMILAVCGRAASDTLETGTPCDLLPEKARAFDSKAGVALRYGSPQLAALKPFPKNVKVYALAGDTVFTVPKAGWFHLPWEVDNVSVGDLAVMADSATSGAFKSTKASCTYQLSPVRAATDQIGLAMRLTAKNDVAQPITSVLGACFHSNLMRTIELTNEATGIISEDVTSRHPVTTNTPVNPNMIRFDGIGELTLRLTARDLQERGYVNKGNLYEGINAACVNYAKDGQLLSFGVESRTGRVLAIQNSGGSRALRTQIGGIHVGSTLAQLRAAFTDHRVREHFNSDFGQGTNGVIVDGPGGSIGFSLEEAPKSDYTTGRAKISHLNGIGLPDHVPTNMEDGC